MASITLRVSNVDQLSNERSDGATIRPLSPTFGADPELENMVHSVVQSLVQLESNEYCQVLAMIYSSLSTGSLMEQAAPVDGPGQVADAERVGDEDIQGSPERLSVISVEDNGASAMSSPTLSLGDPTESTVRTQRSDVVRVRVDGNLLPPIGGFLFRRRRWGSAFRRHLGWDEHGDFDFAWVGD